MAKVRSLSLGAASLLLAAFAVPQTYVPAHAEQIAATVNSTVITSSDVARRISFLRLRGIKGNLPQKAREELVNEVLMRQEIIRTGTSVSTQDVDAAFERFAKNNKMTASKLTEILKRAGVGADHFKAYIGVSMSWPKTVSARFGGGNRMSQDEFIAKLKENNGQKPTVTEYFIQQVIFVIPEKKRNAITGKRKAEAEASRKSYPGCKQAKVFAAGFRDVSIRDVGRVLEGQMPKEMQDQLSKLSEGQTTKVSLGPYGVEYYAICKKRQVSDDMAAQITYQTQDLDKAKKDGENPDAKKYLEDLRKQSNISIR
ncbi:MAG: peptidylprolyl isomerase [Rhizobiaceae bacterium]|nr:peptidylprolyl isomerase [Rhizobiaceae bacterium]